MNRIEIPALSRRGFNGILLGGCASALLPALVGGCTQKGGSARSVNALDGLARSRPEAQGVDPASILAFLDEVSAAGLELHSFMLARNRQVIAEGWWYPYRADRPHMMHSLTKSVAVSGVGLALDEGRFALDDKVVSFFDEELPQVVDEKLGAMTVRDLLTMQTGHAEEISGSVWRPIKTSWVAEFFKVPVVHQPGTTFVYSSAATFMLSAIVTKTTGQTLRDYMEPRFFQPLGIKGLSWDVGPGGINPGGNGLTWKTADSLKLGILYEQDGMWEGKRILSSEWVRAATTPQVSDGGYGYQWWIGPDEAYYALGLFVQTSIVFPEHDAVLAVTSAIDGSAKLLPIVWKAFPSAFRAGPKPVNEAGYAALEDRTSKLTLLPDLTLTTSPIAARISGRTFRIAPNPDGVETVALTFAGDQCRFELRDARGLHRVVVGLDDWVEGETSMTGNKLHHEYQPDSMVVVGGGRWIDPTTFEMIWQFAETAFRDRVLCRFNGNEMTLDRSVNLNTADTSLPTLRGQLA